METQLAEQLAQDSSRQKEDLMDEDPNQALVSTQSEVLKDAPEAARNAQRCSTIWSCFNGRSVLTTQCPP